jgi:glycosyltransferase involved in cell wall biosynthesis
MNHNDPSVTCIIVTYNYGRFLDRAIESVFAQEGVSLDQLEVIVIDDGSTDDTPQLLASYGDRLKVIRQENQGPSVALDVGLRASHGKYVALLDADDEWLPDRLWRSVRILEENAELGLVHGDMRLVDALGSVTHASLFDLGALYPDDGNRLGALLHRNEVTTSAITVRGDLARVMPACPPWAWCRDWWMAVHVAATHDIAVIRSPIALYRAHGENYNGITRRNLEHDVRLRERDIKVREELLTTVDLRRATRGDFASALRHTVELARDLGWLQADRDALVHERDALVHERDGLVHERDALVHERDGLAHERDGLVHERDGLAHERDRLAAEAASAKSQLDDLSARLDAASGQLRQMQELVQAMESSSSWRLTKPLREATRLFRSLR